MCIVKKNMGMSAKKLPFSAIQEKVNHQASVTNTEKETQTEGLFYIQSNSSDLRTKISGFSF